MSLARAFARDRGVPVVFIPFRWPELISDLEANRFDLAMSGVTVRPERSLAGRFSIAVAGSGAVALVRQESTLRRRADLMRPGLRFSVNAGGHLERTVRALFPRATVLPALRNDRVLAPLLEGRAEVAFSDTREAPGWQADHSGLRAIGPLTRDRKAALVRADRPGLARDLDAWLLSREADGSLGRLRIEHLGAAGPAMARPLPALLAAMDERLALMPVVAEVKRIRGQPVRAPDREEVVLRAGIAAVTRAAEERHRLLPPVPAIRAFYRAQIEAAVVVQQAVLSGPASASKHPLPDLAGDLRPALLRIGDRMAQLLVLLPDDLDIEDVSGRVREELMAHGLPEDATRALAKAISGLGTSGRKPSSRP